MLVYDMVLGLAASLIAAQALPGTVFQVEYPKEAFGGSFSGRVAVFLSSRPDAAPLFQARGPVAGDPAGWVCAEWKDVKGARPDVPILLDGAGPNRFFPAGAGKPATAQAVFLRNLAEGPGALQAGNLYSPPAAVPPGGGSVKLVCDGSVHEPDVRLGERVKEVELESTLLSNALRRSVSWRAALILPDAWSAQPRRTFPIVLDLPDYGGTIAEYPSRGTNAAASLAGAPALYLRLDTEDLPVVDGAVAGARATSLLKEFLPYVEKEYRGDPRQVVVQGRGQGGWSALWLAATAPGAFAGAWAVDPDPVDFSQFYGANLSSSTNLFTTGAGGARAFGRAEFDWRTWFESQAFLAEGPLSRAETAFSPRARNGRPLPLCDATGRLEPAALKSWAKFDLVGRLLAEPDLLAQVGGKLHVFADARDPEMRDAGAKLLARALGPANAKNVVIRDDPAGGAREDAALWSGIARQEAAALQRGRP